MRSDEQVEGNMEDLATDEGIKKIPIIREWNATGQGVKRRWEREGEIKQQCLNMPKKGNTKATQTPYQTMYRKPALQIKVSMSTILQKLQNT